VQAPTASALSRSSFGAVRRVGRFVASALVFGALSLGFAPRADAAPPNGGQAKGQGATLVIVTDTPSSKKVVAGLGAKLQDPWKVGDDGAVRKSLSASGQRTPTNSIGNPTLKGVLVKSGKKAAAAGDATLVLFVKAVPKGAKTTVSIVAVTPNEDQAAIDLVIDAPAGDDGDAVFAAIKPTLDRLGPKSSGGPAVGPASPPPPPAAKGKGKEPPPPPPEEKKEPPPAEEDHGAAQPLGGPGRSIFILGAGAGIGSRFFSYHDGLSKQLRTYDLAGTPNLLVAAELYPFAHGSTTVLHNLGIAGGFQHALALSSATDSGTKVSTAWLRAEAELRFRAGFGGEPIDPRFILGARAGLVIDKFDFTGTTAAAKALVGELPDVDYTLFRIGLDNRLRAGPVGILFNGSFMLPFSGGPLADRFRETSFHAVEFGGGVALPIVRVFEVRGTVEYTRMFYSFNPKPGDAFVAGGALDNFINAQIMATLLL
jgi:hypothetical protein